MKRICTVHETHLQLHWFVRPWPVPQSKHNLRLYKIGGPVGHGHDYNPYDPTDDGVTWMLGESVDVSPSRPPQLSHLPSPVAPPRTTPGAGPSGSAPVDADDGPPASHTRLTVQDARRNEKLSSLEVSKLGTGLSRELAERTLFRSKFRKRNSCPTPLYFETYFEKCS